MATWQLIDLDAIIKADAVSNAQTAHDEENEPQQLIDLDAMIKADAVTNAPTTHDEENEPQQLIDLDAMIKADAVINAREETDLVVPDERKVHALSPIKKLRRFRSIANVDNCTDDYDPRKPEYVTPAKIGQICTLKKAMLEKQISSLQGYIWARAMDEPHSSILDHYRRVKTELQEELGSLTTSIGKATEQEYSTRRYDMIDIVDIVKGTRRSLETPMMEHKFHENVEIASEANTSEDGLLKPSSRTETEETMSTEEHSHHLRNSSDGSEDVFSEFSQEEERRPHLSSSSSEVSIPGEFLTGEMVGFSTSPFSTEEMGFSDPLIREAVSTLPYFCERHPSEPSESDGSDDGHDKVDAGASGKKLWTKQEVEVEIKNAMAHMMPALTAQATASAEQKLMDVICDLQRKCEELEAKSKRRK